MADDHRQQFHVAQDLYRQGKYSEALALLDNLLARFPETKELLVPRAQCLHRLGRLQEASDTCDRVIQKWNDPSASTLKARIQMKIEKAAAANSIAPAAPSRSIPVIPAIPPIAPPPAAAPVASAPPASRAAATTFCANHPTAPAHARCSGCSEPFCVNCLVDIHGRWYCGACKVLALQGMAGAQLVTTRQPSVPVSLDNTSLDALNINLDGPVFGGKPVGRMDDLSSGGGGGGGSRGASGVPKEAKEALFFAILSWFCCGFIFGALALQKASAARTELANHPNMSGGGIILAAQIIAGLGIFFWAVGLILRVVGS